MVGKVVWVGEDEPWVATPPSRPSCSRSPAAPGCCSFLPSCSLTTTSSATTTYRLSRTLFPARRYQASRVDAHTQSPDQSDPCEACWGAGEDEHHEGKSGDSRSTEDPGWGTRLAWALGVIREREGTLEGADGGGAVGGVGAFYYYTLHTTFTALRLKLKKAQQVAGDVREEVAALEEKITHLHYTLVTHFSPRHSPYGQKSAHSARPIRRSRVPDASAPTKKPKSHEKRYDITTRGNQQAHQKPDAGQGSHNRIFPLVINAPTAGTPSVDSTTHNLSSITWHQRLHTSPSTGTLTPSVSGVRFPSEIPQLTKHSRRTPQNLITAAAESSVSGLQSGTRSANRMGTTQLDTSELGERTSGAAGFVGRRVLSVNGVSSEGVPEFNAEVRNAVSVLVMDGDPGAELLIALGSTYPGLRVHLVTSTPSSHPQTTRVRLSVHSVEPNTTWAAAYRNVLRHVTTQYVLVAQSGTSLSRVAGLGMLLWAVEHLGVWAAGGGLLSPSGLWRSGCLTTTYAHYKASWERDHLGTAGGCLLCQALEGPFLALTAAMHHLDWNTQLPTHAAHLDLFLRAAHSHHMLAASCSGSLFSLSSELESPPRASLLSLAHQHNLYSLQLPQSPPLLFSCKEIDAKCGNPSLALPPCCRQELSRLVRFMLDTCEAHGLLCELQEGSLLGALKVGGVMPWERDADITFHTKNYTALEELKDVFQRAGYSLHLTDNRWCCVDGRWAGGQGSLSSGRWRAELWSQHAMDSEENVLAGRPRTRVEFEGSWVAAPSSPGQYVRNRYGPEVYRHAQHWLDTGRSSGWDEYEAGKFLPCSSPAHHACLDQYLPDGNLRLHPLCIA